jgi:hypothetical protein
LYIYPNPVAGKEQITVSLTNGFSLYENPVTLKLFAIDGTIILNENYSIGKFRHAKYITYNSFSF